MNIAVAYKVYSQLWLPGDQDLVILNRGQSQPLVANNSQLSVAVLPALPALTH